MKHGKLNRMILAALFAAMACVSTMLIQIPIPATNGYINLGDGVVLLSAFLLGPVYGAAAAGLGSMLADLLLGYAVYAPGTLILKGLMAFSAATVLRLLRERTKAAALIGALAGEIIMVLGYFAYESALLGYGLAAAAAIPGNILQGIGGLISGVAVYHALYAIPSVKKFTF